MNTTHSPSNRLESTAFYVLLATIILAPLAFLPTPYIALDAIKTVIIALGTLISAILYGVSAWKARSVVLPPKSVFWTSILLVISLVVSASLSAHAGKSFFGQGFELTTASFMTIVILAALVAFTAIQRRVERVTVLYVGMAVPFIILFILHGLRLLIGPDFMSLGVLSALTTTFIGSWYDLATYALVVVYITTAALLFLSLSRRIRIVYWILLVISLATAFLINSVMVWSVATLVFLGFTVFATTIKQHSTSGSSQGGLQWLKRIAWLPLLLCLIAALFAWQGVSLAGPAITKLEAQYTSLTLPWQLTLGVNASTLQNDPLFGVGPNQFSRAYTSYKPAAINATYAWSAEFNQAFSLFATMVATQGVTGIIAWGLFLVFMGMAFVRMLRRLPADPQGRFIVSSSVFVATFLWVLSFVSVPSHVILYYALIATGIAMGAAVAYGLLTPWTLSAHTGGLLRRAFVPTLLVLVVAGVLWGIIYIKDTVALSYFGSGIKSLTVRGDALSAADSFAHAQRLNASDIYLQASAEASIARANQLITSANQNPAQNAAPSASSSQALVEQVVAAVNTGVGFAQAAVVYDPSNYYNYVSEARVSEFAASIRMDKAYENAVASYTSAIRLNPLNPSLYLNLAQLQASQNKLDDAVKTLGAALQVKNNYLEAVFLLSQVTAAQGNLRDAIIAAQVATQINPNNPVLFFQLGLLQYNNKDYVAAATALEKAIALRADYANAQYFLGLSYARLNRSGDAIAQFAALAETNPDNREVGLILSNLQAGKSPFADARPPVTPAPEKRPALPIKEKAQ